ncbi:hypothetical protein CEXT_618111 [Caerostris extrusa]|uniref:Uncharacterized protein n=1 Tax=Caerostris extrusa TaxID=172846 RepID=A0AAV4TD14_CAEEX|nr:hypothetical protein CEXT_618111 [Caerostris extrusa]
MNMIKCLSGNKWDDGGTPTADFRLCSSILITARHLLLRERTLREQPWRLGKCCSRERVICWKEQQPRGEASAGVEVHLNSAEGSGSEGAYNDGVDDDYSDDDDDDRDQDFSDHPDVSSTANGERLAPSQMFPFSHLAVDGGSPPVRWSPPSRPSSATSRDSSRWPPTTPGSRRGRSTSRKKWLSFSSEETPYSRIRLNLEARFDLPD